MTDADFAFFFRLIRLVAIVLFCAGIAQICIGQSPKAWIGMIFLSQAWVTAWTRRAD